MIIFEKVECTREYWSQAYWYGIWDLYTGFEGEIEIVAAAESCHF